VIQRLPISEREVLLEIAGPPEPHVQAVGRPEPEVQVAAQRDRDAVRRPPRAERGPGAHPT
jgi:hypothetical protein